VFYEEWKIYLYCEFALVKADLMIVADVGTGGDKDGELLYMATWLL
jgi:hypothetical protein